VDYHVETHRAFQYDNDERNQMRISKTVKAVVAAAVFGCAGFASAATNTTNLSVTANVNKNCTITTTPVAFGIYDPLGTHASADLDGTGTVTITCTRGTTARIGLDLGANVNAGARRMTDGSSNFLSYQLFRPSSTAPNAACAFTSAWGDTFGTNSLDPAAAPSKAVRTFNVCGRVAQNQDPVPGNYTDTVIATVDF
jgi:spore coat protein U-like protein